MVCSYEVSISPRCARLLKPSYKQLMKKLLVAFPIVVLLAAGCNSKKPSPINPVSTKSATSTIAVGQPCDFHSIQSYGAGGSVTGTHGLQCYLYGPGGANRSGVWIMPNNVPVLSFAGYDSDPELPNIYGDALTAITRTWQTYISPDKAVSFKYSPQYWSLDNSQWSSNNLIHLQEQDSGPVVNIQYYSNTNFQDGMEGQITGTDRFPGGTGSLNNNLEVLADFQLNGKQAFAIIQLPQVSAGNGDSDQVTVYIVGKNDYLTVTYSRYGESDEDLPTEALISSIQIK